MGKVASPRFYRIFLRRNTILCPFLNNIGTIILASVSFISKYSRTFYCQFIQSWTHHNAVVNLSTRQHQDKRIP